MLAVVLALYANTLWDGFTFDDFHYVLDNPTVTTFSLKGLFAPAKLEERLRFFRPLTFATYQLNWAFTRARPWSYHLFNAILHALVCLLLYLVLRRLLTGIAGEALIAWVAAGLFAVHPIHAEAVASVVGRSELLAAVFLLTAWLLHLREQTLPELACFALAMLAKESAVAYLPLVFLGDFARGKLRPVWRYAAIAAVTVGYVALFWMMHGRQFAERNVTFLTNPLAGLPPGLRIANAVCIAWKYIELLSFPATLSCDYSFNAIPVYATARHLAPAILAAVLVLLAWFWALWTRRTAWALAGTIYFAAFAATSNILVPTGTILGERLAYLPSAGFCLFVALLWNKWQRYHPKLAYAILGVVLVLFASRTALRNRDWRDNLTLFSAGVRAVPDSAKLHDALGGEYLNRGQKDAAMEQLRAAVAIYPLYPQELRAAGVPEESFRFLNVAVEHRKRGQNDDALFFLNLAIAKSPNFSFAWSNRAFIYFERGDAKQAREEALTALRLDPTNPQARYLLSQLAAR